MKRKRTPSPATATQRHNSRSPMSSRSTRAGVRTPPHSNGGGNMTDEDENVHKVNGDSSIRRSSRARRLSYPSYHPDFMTHNDVIRNRDVHAHSKEPLTNGNSSRHRRKDRSSTPESDIDSPFFHHVRFSPSAKPGSPARRFSRQRAAASIAKMRLQNVPSEDEQSEFNRRYSRDLRSRRQQERTDDPSSPKTRRSTSRQRVSKPENDDHDDDNNMEEQPEEDTTPRRSSRRRNEGHQHNDAEDEESEEADEEEQNGSKIRRITRNRSQNDDNEEEAPEEDEEDLPLGRRSRRSINKSKDENGVDDDEDEKQSMMSEPVMRRSARSHKPSSKSKSSSDDDNEEVGRSRPKRSRAPVERFGYEAPSESTSRRRRSSEVRNLDQYSSDDEFQGDSDERPSRRRKRYNMRTKKLKPKSYRSRDTSSSSSSEDNVDEQRFVKRKNKRMMIERSKLRPVNMSKHDATKAIFRDRQSVGASMADIQPMEMDMGVTFESVGGVDDHVNSLREMVIFPLLYPEIFTKFSMTPPRGVLFYGPPGTGKTLIARALASECSREGRKVAFFMRKGADCLSKWIGESERQLRLLFDQAYLMRPSIIFFDEIDGLAPVRSSRNDQIHSSIVSTLLALMDGLDNRGEIIVIGATNRIENIDPALRRPGRFDRELRFSLPTRDSRKAILDLHTKKWNPPVEPDTLDLLADKTIGYSGADLRGLCAEAALIALRRRYPQVYKTSQKLALDFDQIKITETDFSGAMARLVPSTHRIQDQSQSPLIPQIRPLLGPAVTQVCQKIDDINKGHEFSYRPRVLIRARPGQCVSTYIGPAVLHHLEKLPCHKLDIPSLFSNSARSPEEAMFHIIHEAKRTVPSVLYIPHLLRLWNEVLSGPQRVAFLAMMSDIQPRGPLIIIAFTEEQVGEDSGEIIEQMFDADTEIIEIQNPDSDQRRRYFQPIFDAALQAPEEEEERAESKQDTEVLAVLPIPESRELTEKEEKRLRRKEDTLLRELRIFLRDTWQKINREQRFFMFRTAVDTEEIYDYLDYVEKPMDFDQMLTKLDNGEYHCAQNFLDDIDLIAENAIKYNSDLNYETNKVICHRARALQDFAYAIIKADMDTDFEDNCKEIVQRRKKLTEKLSQPAQMTAFNPHTNEIVQVPAGTSLNGNVPETDKKATPTTKKRKKPMRKSRWSSGILKKPKAKPKDNSPSSSQQTAADEESLHNASNVSEAMEQDHGEESESDEEVTLNESKDFQIDAKKIGHIHDDLVKRTEHLTIENLERIFVKLMECVSAYKKVYDRTQLPTELMERLDSLKILPTVSTKKKTASPR